VSYRRMPSEKVVEVVLLQQLLKNVQSLGISVVALGDVAQL
ncbi:hypothetical protein THOM_0301, partial [Trachipleistophora hominis]